MPPSVSDVRARAESDLPDGALQALIDEAVSEITDRYGPWRNLSVPLALTLPGRRRRLDLARPLDIAQAVTVTEWFTANVLDVEAFTSADEWVDVGETSYLLSAQDYRVWNGGRTLERLFTGPTPRTRWGSRVDITYIPVEDSPRRDEVVLKLVMLSIEYEGVVDRRVGDVQTTHAIRSSAPGSGGLVFHSEREALLSSLQPRRGLMLR